MPTEAVEQPTTAKISRRQHLKEQVHALALCIGLRPAARKMGINENTAISWSSRDNWELPEVFKLNGGRPLLRGPKPDSVPQSQAISAHEGIDEAFREQSEDTRMFLSSAALKAAHAAASMDGKALLGKVESQSMLNVARTGDVTHGWQAARQQPAVQIANVVLPTPEQSADLKAVDRKLDALTRMFNTPPAGGGGAPRNQDG